MTVRVKSEILKKARDWEEEFSHVTWEFSSLEQEGFDDHDDPLYQLVLKNKKDGQYYKFEYSESSAWSSLDEWKTFVGEPVELYTSGFYVSASEYEANINSNPTSITIYAYDGNQWLFNSDDRMEASLPDDLKRLKI